MRVPRNLLRDRITVEPYAGSGSRGPAYGDPVEDVRANLQPTSRLVTTADGRTVTADVMAILRPEEAVPAESRVTWKGRKYRVIQAAHMPDEFRPTHLELTLGRFA